jgi:uncharacterized protein YqgC (DUF456 family)
VTAVAGVDVLVLLTVVLLVVGVVGSVVPGLPGALLSLAGVSLYWWHTGYADPGTLWLVLLTLAGLVAIGFDLLGGAVATRAGGGSSRSTFAAAVVGFLLFFVAGPFGVIVGVAGTVFVLELVGGGTTSESLRTAAYATAGVLASAVVQLLVTLSILVAMLAFIFVW